jgi:hypothetical protein
MGVLEGRAEALAGTFNAQEVANTLWAYATMGREPGAWVMRGLEGRAEALAGTMNAQDVSTTLWAYATMGWKPWAGLMWVLEGRAQALAGTPDGQDAGILEVWHRFASQIGSKTSVELMSPPKRKRHGVQEHGGDTKRIAVCCQRLQQQPNVHIYIYMHM